jgi:tetratricopeptide (TPR) repeat protein
VRRVHVALAVIAALAPVTPSVPLGAQTSPTFSRDVAPIVFARCAACHHPGGPAPFSLLTYAGARAHARQMADATRTRYMPPWKAEESRFRFVGENRLSEAEIAVISRWAESGAQEGDPRDLPPPPRLSEGWQLGTPDLVVSMPAFTLPPSGSDVFRIFVAPVARGGLRYVRGFEFRPGNAGIVHHATVRIDRTAAARRLDEQDPEPGYDGLMPHSATYPDGHFLGWAPGQVAPLLPAGMAWRLHDGADLVIELHMQPTGRAESVAPSIGLYFAAEPPQQTPAMLRLGRQKFDIPPGADRYVVEDAFTLPVDVELQAILPHAHNLARVIEAFADLPDGSRTSLLRISDWDFKWQQVYRYATPLALPKGAVVSMRYTYDNSQGNPRNPSTPPRRVIWGQQSRDEMGDLWLQVLARSEGERGVLSDAFRPKAVAEDIVGYEERIRVEPDSAALHDDVALLYLETGQLPNAIEHFHASLRLRPDLAAAHFNLGTALAFAGRSDEAMTRYERALQLRPSYALAHNNLGGLLMHRGELERALEHLRQAVAIDPSNPDAQENLGRAYRLRGDEALASRHLQEARRLRQQDGPP